MYSSVDAFYEALEDSDALDELEEFAESQVDETFSCLRQETAVGRATTRCNA